MKPLFKDKVSNCKKQKYMHRISFKHLKQKYNIV